MTDLEIADAFLACDMQIPLDLAVSLMGRGIDVEALDNGFPSEPFDIDSFTLNN